MGLQGFGLRWGRKAREGLPIHKVIHLTGLGFLRLLLGLPASARDRSSTPS